MQAILKKLTKLINNNSPRRVIPDTRKLFWNDSTRRSIITRNATIIIAFLALTVNGLVYFSDQAFAEAGASLTFTVNVPTDSLLEVKLFNADGTEMGSNTSMNVVPSMSAAGFNEKEVVVSVGTNNEWGYNLMMNIDNTSLVSSSDSSKTIPSLAAGTTYTCTKETADTCNFTLNSWGFQIKDDTASQSATNGYIAIPSSIELNKNTTTTNGDPTHILFGSKINAQQAPGAYSTTINFVATANPEPCSGEMLGGTCITSMQDFGDLDAAALAAVKNAMIKDKQYQFKDSRDGKLYWVAKLKDGNVWMTQNLDYDIKTTGNEVAVIGGTTTTWSPNTATSTSVFNNSSYTGTYSYDPGSSYLPNGTGSPTGITCTSASNGGDNCHYHLGNYYQWNAATAGTGGSITNADATTSICPKGWRLPTSNSYTNNYSFGKLTNAYGITNSTNGSSDAALRSSPLWFVRAGNVNNGNLNNQGSNGNVWSSRANSNSNNAYNLNFNSSNVNPSNNNNRNNGFSVRCVAE